MTNTSEPGELPRKKLPKRVVPSPEDLNALSTEEIIRIFRPSDRYAQLLRAHTDAARIALYYHAAYLEAFGQSAPYGPIPDRVAAHIAKVLGLEVALPLPYPDARATFFQHAERARASLGWQKFTPAARKSFERWLAEEARRSIDTDYLRDLLLRQLFADRVLIPAEYRIERMVSRARVEAQEWIAKTIITHGLTEAQLTEIDLLRRLRRGTHRTMLQWLKDPIGQASPHTLDDILDRLEYLNGLGLSDKPFEQIHPDMRRRITKTVQTYSTDGLWEFKAERRQAYVACYLYERRRELIDLAIEAFDGIVQGMHRRSERDLLDEQRKRGPSINEKLLILRTTLGVLLDEEHVSDPVVRPRTYAEIPRAKLLQAQVELEELIRPADYNYLDYFKLRYTYARSWFPRFLRLVEFDGLPRAASLLEAVATLRIWNEKRVRKITEPPPLDFVPEKWRPYVEPAPGVVDRHYWELCVLDTLHSALQSGDVWAVGGRRYGDVEDLLIPPDQWRTMRDECYRELGLPRDPMTWLAEILPTLQNQIEETTRGLEANPQTFVEGGFVHLHPIEAVPEPDGLRALKARVESSWPQIRIQDLLVEIDSWVGFTKRFRTLQGRGKAKEDIGRGLMAGLIAKGCNIGMTKMASLTPGVREGTLRRVDELYLFEDNLREAFLLLEEAHRELPMSEWLGDPHVSMSDGLKVVTRVGTLRAALQPQLLGPGKRALTFYYHVLHRGPGFGAQVIGHDRDAAYVLDQIFHIQSELPILRHYTDTHGSTEVTFSIAYPNRIEFAPRIKQVHEQDLYHPPGAPVPGPFALHFAGAVDTELIETYWDDYVRILSSIRRGRTSAVLLSLRLSSYAKQNPLYRALREVGRIYKTRFIMRYYHDALYRRAINAGLARIEHFNELARILYFARRGENWEREFEQQLNRASALLFLANACVLWNTVRLSEAYKQIKQEHLPCEPADFRHISPYAFEHIIPYGEYVFRRKPEEGREAFDRAKVL